MVENDLIREKNILYVFFEFLIYPVKNRWSALEGATPPSTPNNNMHTDIAVLAQNVLLINCGLISHQNEQNKKKLLKSLHK